MGLQEILEERNPIRSYTVDIRKGDIESVRKEILRNRKFFTVGFLCWCLFVIVCWCLWGYFGYKASKFSEREPEAFITLFLGLGIILLMILIVSFYMCYKNEVFKWRVGYLSQKFKINGIRVLTDGIKINTLVEVEDARIEHRNDKNFFIFEGNIKFNSEILLLYNVLHNRNDEIHYVYCPYE